jgi:replicative DNA helicase
MIPMVMKRPEQTILSTGFPTIDSMLGGGLRTQSLNYVIGSAASGKTAIINKIASTHSGKIYIAFPSPPNLHWFINDILCLSLDSNNHHKISHEIYRIGAGGYENIIHELKAAAIEYNSCLVISRQINRKYHSPMSPELVAHCESHIAQSDLGGWSISKSDVVLFVNKYYSCNCRGYGYIDVIKNRYGNTGRGTWINFIKQNHRTIAEENHVYYNSSSLCGISRPSGNSYGR